MGSDARGRGIVYQANGYRGERVSTHAVEFAIQNYSTISDAVAYSYQQEGHKFYVLSFPTANATWAYDTITGAWHERAGLTNGVFTRHRANCQMNFNNQTIVGDYEDGRIYAFDLDVYADDDRVQKWLRSWRALPTGTNNLRRTAHHTLQLDCQSGVGTGANIDADLALDDELDIEFITEDDVTLLLDETPIAGTYPQAILRWSDDAGHTWSREHWTSLGAIGRYGQRVFWQRLGMTMKLRDRVYEVSGTDPTKLVIMGAELILDGTSS